MARFESVDAWKAYEITHLEKVEHGLHVIRDEMLIGTDPVAAFVLGGNMAVNDSVDAVFAHYLGRIAYNTGLLDAVMRSPYDQEEVTIQVVGLSQLGEIDRDARNPAKYFHPKFER